MVSIVIKKAIKVKKGKKNDKTRKFAEKWW